MKFLKRILSTIVATSMCCTLFGGFNTIRSSADTDDTSIKILPVGDSITDGYWESGSYRKYMYNYLIENGFNIDMVGNKGMDLETSNDISYDGNYCAYSGYAIQHITGTEERQGIYEVLVNENIMETYNPDIVLLQIGTNDVLSAYNDGIIDRLENLVDYIISYMEQDDTLFVTTIPNFDVSVLNDAGWLWAYGWGVPNDELTNTIQSSIDSYNSTDLYDGVHPNEVGYQKMGEYWSNVLTSYLKDKSAITTTVTTSPIDVTSVEPTTTEPVPVLIKGDANNDGSVDKLDLLILKKSILGLLHLDTDLISCFDLDDNNKVDITDYIMFKNIVIKSN